MIKSSDQRRDFLPKYPVKPTDLVPIHEYKKSYTVWVPVDRNEKIEQRFGDSAGSIVRFQLEREEDYHKHWFGGNEEFSPAWYAAVMPAKKGDTGGKIVAESIEDGKYIALPEILDQ